MENINDKLHKYLSGDCNEDEKITVLSWIAESAENQKLFGELKEIWENSCKIANNIVVHPENAWENIKHETGIKEGTTKVVKFRPVFRTLLKYAAVLLIFVFAGFAIKLVLFQKPEIIIASTLNSSKQEIRLSDGTIVFMNRGSQLKYPEKFITKTREIELEGEAFFKVAKDSLHPFVIHAKGTVTKVLGTSFDINTKDPGKVRISVFSGKVAFQSEKYKEKLVKLVKGENGIFNVSDFSVTKQNAFNDNIIAWQTGILKFNNTDLNEAAKVLSEYYTKQIEVSPQLRNRTISVTLNNQTINKTIEIIELTLSIKADSASGIIKLNPLDI